jgi:uncharacterized protein YjiS (DUF1127 family)
MGKALRSSLLAHWRALQRWRRNAHAVAALEALDARLLKDIGIERSEIGSVVRGLGRDASRVDRTVGDRPEDFARSDILRRGHP